MSAVNILNVLLLEGVHQSAVSQFENKRRYRVKSYSSTLEGSELLNALEGVHILGIRSRTQVTADVLSHATKLLAIGCFCIGTNQVDLDEAQRLGIAVFNSPFCNSRSVAELIIAQTINLSRRLGDANIQMHRGEWIKSSKNRNEIRGKTLGIIGYGNIGSQLSVLAEGMGMNVLFYDIIPKLALGNATNTSLDDLLVRSDFVSVHVPETPDTKQLIDSDILLKMKKGSILLNASRGSVIDVDALVESLRSGHVGGAYLDVYPNEPKTKQSEFKSKLQNIPNVILTPHIGGATEEAQHSIGKEVANKLIKFVSNGTSYTSVNFPNIGAHHTPNTYRVVNVHHNTPGVLKQINEVLSEHNITLQILGTTDKIGYLIADVDATNRENNDILGKVGNLEHSIKTRILN